MCKRKKEIFASKGSQKDPAKTKKDTTKQPILFVPGLMASRLKLKQKKVWDPDYKPKQMKWLRRNDAIKKREILHWGSLSEILETDSSCKDVQKKERGWHGVCWKYYKKLLQFLEKQGEFEVYAFPYDWRRSNLESAKDLAKRVMNIYDDHGKVIIVTHSMGGLVARAAMKCDDNFTRRVSGVIHIAQPVTGASCGYRRFFTGGSNDHKDGAWCDILSNGKKWVGAASDKPDPKAAAIVLSACPSWIQLLPTANYRISDDLRKEIEKEEKESGTTLSKCSWASWIWIEQPSQKAQPVPWPDDKDSDVWEKYMSSIKPEGSKDDITYMNLQTHFGTAKRFHDIVGTTPHFRTYSIYSTGLETDVAVRVKLNGEGKLEKLTPIRRKLGDGTVAIYSAKALFPGENPVHLESKKPKAQKKTRIEANKETIDKNLQKNDGKLQFEFEGYAHDEICKMDDVIAAVFQLVQHIHRQSR